MCERAGLKAIQVDYSMTVVDNWRLMTSVTGDEGKNHETFTG